MLARLTYSRLLVVATSSFVAGVIAAKPAQPVSARIMWTKDRQAEPGHFGDVLVQFSDGTKQMWTSKGGCMLAKVSPSGLVGWTRGSYSKFTGHALNPTLVIARRGTVISRVAAKLPIIEEWDFADADMSVIVESRGSHGPSTIEKFSLPDGRLVAEVPGLRRSAGKSTGLGAPLPGPV